VQQHVQQPERLLPIARNRYSPLRGITAAEPVAGIVLGMVVFGDSIRMSPGLILLGACGLIALLIGVILVARSPGLSRRPRSRPLAGLSCIQRGRWQPPDRDMSGDEEGVGSGCG
jgi:hypothetical protein